MVERKCKQCGKVFFVRHSVLITGRGKYCSKKCVYLAKRKIIKCKRCGKMFSVIKARFGVAKYCSMACYSMGSVQKKCKNCGKKYNIKKYKIKQGLGLFCSRKCHYAYKQTIVKCKNCGKKFTVGNWQINRTKNNKIDFCSRKCLSEYAFVERTCMVCGKIFKKHKSDLKNTINCKKSKLNGRFCSQKCAIVYKMKMGSKIISCKRCGKQIRKKNSQIKYGRKYCSKKCSNESGRKYPIEIRKCAMKEKANLRATFGGNNHLGVIKKTWAIKTALNKGILDKPLLTKIQKGATYEAYI